MANYYLNNDGTLSKENKKKKGKNYILQEDGSLILSPEDTAPVKTSASKRTWFNSGLFEDGLDFEDIPKTLLGTNVDFAEDLSSGLAGIGEGIIDTVATGVGAIAKKLGKDDFADKTQKFIERDLVNEYKWDEKLASKIPGVETLQMANVVANKGDTEKVSVLGEKTDAVVQSAGQLSGTYGLQAVGVPWWLTTGVTSFGGGAEEAFQNDATYGEAGTYGLINAGAEIISEKLTGGIKFGGVALDEGLKKTLTKGISNKVAKTLVNFGWDAAGEGFEEVFSEVMTNIGKKLTYEKESTLEELLLSEDAMDAYLESFIGGAVLGGGANVGKVARSAKTGRDYDTGLTVNEQSVVDAEVKNRITERQKNVAVKEKIDQLITEQEKTFGILSDSEKKRIKEQVQSQLEEIDYTTTKISKKEQTEIEKQVREDLEKGYIGIEQIESTLASEKTAEIKDLESQLVNTTDEIKKSEIQAKIKQLKADRATQLTGALGKDTYLQESYRQEALKSKEFSREVKEEDTDITKELLESAKNSKMNDTRRMHDLFEYTNKIANDTGTKYGFVNNEQLKQLGHDVEGRTINGLVRVNEDGTTKILINIDSDKSLNTIIGHETAHLFEGTSEYKALQDIAKEYAITKGEYDSRLKQIQSLYEGTNANIENEITADLVGDYLFTDEQFINSLSTKQPNVFQKIYDYIKHAYKMATAGSKEARQLEQLKRRFDKAYKEMSKTTTGKVDSNLTKEADSDTKYSISDNQGRQLTKEQQEYFKDSQARDENGSLATVYHGTNNAGFTVFERNVNFYTDSKDVAGTYTNKDGVYEGYLNIKNPLVIDADGEKWSRIDVAQVDPAVADLFNEFGVSTFMEDGAERTSTADIVGAVEDGIDEGILDYDGIIFKNIYDEGMFGNVKAGTLKSNVYVTFNSNQFKNADNTNPTSNPDIRFSLSDSNGRELTKEQQEYFKDSKVRDEDGNLRVVYHGSSEDFTVFDRTKARANMDIQGNFFSPWDLDAQGYGENVRAFYLNITNPAPEDIAYKALNKFKGQNGAGIKAREYLESLGYDGVNNGDEEYITFYPHQIKSTDNGNPTDNPDINLSLSKPGEDIPTDGHAVYGRDVKLQEGIAPIREDIQDLKNALSDLRENVTALAPEPEGYKALAEEDLPYIEQEREESFRNITEDSAPVEQEYYNMPDTAPLDDKSLKLLSKNMRQELGLKNNQVAELRKIIQDFSTSETASKEDLYNAIESEFGTIYEKKKLDTVQEIKASLRSMKINVSDTIKSDIPDYFQFKQRNFGKIRFANDGLAVDDVYEGLKDVYPEYFPDNIANPTDQLLKIADVVNMDANYIEEYALPEEQIQEVTDFIYESISDYKRQKRQEASENAAKAPIDESMIPYEVPELVDDIAPVREDLAESDGLKNKIKVVEDNLGKEKKRLDDEYAKTLNPLKEEIKSKEEFISNKALNLYNELKGLKKGVRASDELSYLLDYGFSWNELKTSLLRVKAFPTSEVYSDSAVESIIRETLGREYEEKLYQVSEIEAEYKDAVEKVQKDTFETIRKLKEGKEVSSEADEAPLITKTRKDIRKTLLEDNKDVIMSALENAKNLSSPLMNNTDTIRLSEMVFGRKAGSKINEIIFQKAIDNEAKSVSWQNKERAGIKALGIKPRSKESAAVQKWGEGEYVNEFGDVVEYTDSDLMLEFPNVADQKMIKDAAIAMRAKYDEYIELANGVLTGLGFKPIEKRKNYFMHFQELGDFLSKNGIPFNPQSMKENNLPTDINGLTEFFVPQKKWFASMNQRKGKRTVYDAVTGIDKYISGVADIIYHTEDIQRGRAFEELIRDTYGQGEVAIANRSLLPEELQMERLKKQQDKHLSKYVRWLHNWTDNLAGKKNRIDRVIEDFGDRAGFSTLDTARRQVSANMIGFNLSSSLTNLIASVQAIAKTNKVAVAKGTADTIRNIVQKDDFISKNSFLTNRFGTDMLSKTTWQKIQDAGFVFMKGTDWFTANQIVRSKYYELRSKGMSEEQAHAESGKFAARIMGDRTKGANAQFYNSKLFNVIGQFQLEVNNQLYSMFYDTYHESKEKAKGDSIKTAAGITFTLGQLFAMTHVFGQTFEAVAGYNPTFDVIGIIATALGLGDDDDDNIVDNLQEAADQLLDALPYSNLITGGGRIPLSSALPDIGGLITGKKDNYGNDLQFSKEMAKLPYLLMPAGYGQIKKTTQGLKMFDKDNPVPGSYTDSGNLRFPVEDTAINRIQAGIFGQWSNKNARDYFDNERQPLREKQIQEYKDLDLPIADYWEYREGLKDQKTVEDKFNYIADLDLPIDKKNIMINNAVDRDESIDLTNYDDFSSYEEFDYAIKNPEKYCLSRAVAKEFSTYKTYVSDLNDLRADKDSNGKTISGSRKEKVINYINGLNADYGEKIILFKSEYPADDTYNYEIIDYLNNRQDISYAEMETILKELGFQVDRDGNVRW